MQISNSVGNPIGSHADPANGSGPLANQILSGGGHPQHTAPGKSNGSTAADSEHYGESATAELRSPEQFARRPLNSAVRREARQKNQKLDATANGAAVAVASQETQPVQFLAILGDVQDRQAGVAKAQATSTQVLSQLPGGTSYAVPGNATDGAVYDATAPSDSAKGENQATDSPGAAQQTPVLTMNALLEADQSGSDPKGSAASSSDLAFAARVAKDTRVMTPDEGQAAIAASRFEGMASRNQPASMPRTSPPAAESGVPAQAEELAAVAASPFDAMASGSGSGESPGHAEPDAANAGANPVPAPPTGINQDGESAQALASTVQPSPAPAAASPAVAVQGAAGRTQGTQANFGAMAVKTAAAGQAGSSTSAGPQTASASMVAPGPAGADTASGRSSTSAKPALREQMAQDVQPQNEAADRAGQAVRDISLSLSTKDQNVQVRLSERAGELHVTVRTPDATLTHGLRDGLSDLVGRLEHGGYRAETWQPGGDSRDRGQESPPRRGFFQQQNTGGKGSGRQQNSQDPESERETPKWIGELESSFHKE